MNEIFMNVKKALKVKDLIPFKKENFSIIKQIHQVDNTYEEIKEMFKKEELSISNFYVSKEGLFPFWYIDGFVFLPITTLNPKKSLNQLTKEILKQEKKRLKSYWDEQDYEGFFSQVTTQFSFDLFFSYIEKIPKEERYNIFRSIYVHNEYGFQDINKELIRELFLSNQDKSFLEELPVDKEGYVTIYRGMQDYSANVKEGYSWTLDFEVAKYFATRFNSSNIRIYQAKVRKEDIIDYISYKEEEEILVLPEKLINVQDLSYYNMNEELVEELQEEGIIDMYQKYAFGKLRSKWFQKPDGIHGKRHIKRVLLLSLIMSYLDDLSEEDRLILMYASLYHDIGRHHDHEDEGHGMQSVMKMEKLKLSTKGLNQEEKEILKFLMKYHSIRDEVGLSKIYKEKRIEDKERAIELFNRFKDCDGLDRVRLGDLDIKYLRTETAKKLMIVAQQLLWNIT